MLLKLCIARSHSNRVRILIRFLFRKINSHNNLKKNINRMDFHFVLFFIIIPFLILWSMDAIRTARGERAIVWIIQRAIIQIGTSCSAFFEFQKLVVGICMQSPNPVIIGEYPYPTYCMAFKWRELLIHGENICIVR